MSGGSIFYKIARLKAKPPIFFLKNCRALAFIHLCQHDGEN